MKIDLEKELADATALRTRTEGVIAFIQYLIQQEKELEINKAPEGLPLEKPNAGPSD